MKLDISHIERAVLNEALLILKEESIKKKRIVTQKHAERLIKKLWGAK